MSESDAISGLNALLEDRSRKSANALKAAIRGEGYMLRTVLMSHIRKGTPAPGHPFAPRSMISRLITRNRLNVKSGVPLIKLANAVTYNVSGLYRTDQNYQVEVGFTYKRSPAWAREAAWHQQEGFTRPVTHSMRRFFARMGGRRSASRSRRQKGLARWLFLSKRTNVLKTPARPIIDPFWKWQRQMAIERIKRNYVIKMQGKRFESVSYEDDRFAASEFVSYKYVPARIGPIRIDVPIGRGGRAKKTKWSSR